MLVTLKKKLDEEIIPKSIRADSIIPVLSADENTHIFLQDDMTLGFGFFCDPLYGSDEKTQERVNGFLNQDLPTRTIFQFILYRSPDIDQEINQILGIRDRYRHELLSPVIRERTNFLNHHTTEKIITTSKRGTYDCGLIHDLKLLVICKMQIGASLPTTNELLEAEQLQTKIQSSLQTVGLRPRAMTVHSYKRFMSTILNWGSSPSWRHTQPDWEQDKTIGSQIFDYDCDLQISKDKLQLGNTHIKVLSAKKLPDSMFFGDAMTYVGDLSGAGTSVKENYMVVMNVFFPEIEKTKNAIERKRQFTVNQAYGPLLKFLPILADKKESFDVIYESIKNGSKPVRATYSVVIFAPTAERADAASIAARSIWRESRFELMEDKFVSLPVFINCLPLCADKEVIRDIYRYKTMTTEHLTVLIPIFGEWKGTGSFHAALISRNGQLMSLSLHDGDTNKNAVIAAESGSGKSFLTNELILSYLSEGAQVWVIDAGKSYQKLAGMLDGDFIHFEEGMKVCLNPFELVQNYEDEEDALVSFVCAMASAKGSIGEWEIAALKKVMSELWIEKGNDMQVDDIANVCLAANDPRQRDIGHQLYAFTSSGNYGKYFVGKNNVNFKKQFTVLELDELQGRKHLRQVVLLQLIYQIQQEVFLGERDRKKVVIVDEAWDLLKEGEVATFMEHAYRKFRKYGGSVVICTQSINDLYENAVGRAIAENSASMYLLGQTEETVESIKRTGRLTLSEGGYHTLKGVHTIQGVYSEIFVRSKRGIGIGRLIVGDFQKLLYSTDPVDVNAITQYERQGKSLPDAIRCVIADRHVLHQHAAHA